MKTTSKMTRTDKVKRAKANEVAKANAQRIKDMKAEQLKKEMDDLRLKYAPTLESVESDLLTAMQIICGQFIAKYYPGTTLASVHFSQYVPERSAPLFTALIPVPILTPQS